MSNGIEIGTFARASGQTKTCGGGQAIFVGCPAPFVQLSLGDWLGLGLPGAASRGPGVLPRFWSSRLLRGYDFWSPVYSFRIKLKKNFVLLLISKLHGLGVYRTASNAYRIPFR